MIVRTGLAGAAAGGTLAGVVAQETKAHVPVTLAESALDFVAGHGLGFLPEGKISVPVGGEHVCPGGLLDHLQLFAGCPRLVKGTLAHFLFTLDMTQLLELRLERLRVGPGILARRFLQGAGCQLENRFGRWLGRNPAITCEEPASQATADGLKDDLNGNNALVKGFHVIPRRRLQPSCPCPLK